MLETAAEHQNTDTNSLKKRDAPALIRLQKHHLHRKNKNKNLCTPLPKTQYLLSTRLPPALTDMSCSPLCHVSDFPAIVWDFLLLQSYCRRQHRVSSFQKNVSYSTGARPSGKPQNYQFSRTCITNTSDPVLSSYTYTDSQFQAWNRPPPPSHTWLILFIRVWVPAKILLPWIKWCIFCLNFSKYSFQSLDFIIHLPSRLNCQP